VRERCQLDPLSRGTVIHRGAAWAVLALLLTGLVSCLGSPPSPRDGVRDWEAHAQVAVPGGVVNAAGGTLVVTRLLLSVDTRLGPAAIGAVYHSASGSWLWSFDLRLLDGIFREPAGSVHDVSALPDGASVPGTEWVKLDAARMKTRGGLVHEFDGAGRLAAVYWSSDPYPRLRHVAALVGESVRIVAIEQCSAPGACAPVYALDWDEAGRLAAVEDRAGRRAELAWDAAGRLAAARDAGDVAEGLPGDRYAYEGARITSLTTSDGERTRYVYHAGRLAEAVAEGPGSPRYRFSYTRVDHGVNVTTHVDPLGARSEIEWDDQGRVLRRTLLGLDETERFAWQGFREIRHERSDGTVLARSWAGDLLASETLPDGNVRHYQWNADGVNRLDPFAGALREMRDALGVQIAVVYDAAGRAVQILDGQGDAIRLVWNGVLVDSIEKASGALQRFEGYGEHGWPTRVFQSDQLVDEPVYDAVGNRLRGLDLADPTASSTPGVVERGFDADRRVASLVLVEDQETIPYRVERTLRVVRRADGRPARVERPYGGDTEYLYDALGRMVERRERVDGDFRSTFYEYDAAGRRTAEEKANGMRLEWSHDAAGRTLTTIALRHGLVESVLTHSWAAGRLVASHDSVRDAAELYVHDAAGRLERVVYAAGESTEYGYDARGRLTEVALRLPGGALLSSLSVGYDASDRETLVRADEETLLERVYEQGRLVETRYGNGLTRSYDYHEGTDRWSGALTTDAEDAFVESTVLTGFPPLITGLDTRTADPYGLVPDPPAGSAPGEVRTLEFYALDRGTLEERWHGARMRSAFRAEHYLLEGYTHYDALGNRLMHSQPPAGWGMQRFDYHYNAEHNRLLSVEELRWTPSGWQLHAARSYEWDEAGYATSVNGRPVVWTAHGRIASVGSEAYFQWDAAGRPISRTVLGEETVYWFGGRMEAPPGATPDRLDLGEVRLDLAGGEHLYRHPDMRGNVKFVTDAAGVVVAHHGYGGYGREVTYGPSDDARGFAGGSHAAEFVLLGARVLDAEAGRFLSPDPVDPWLDSYAYTWGNPLHFWDPSGLDPQATPQGPPVAATVADILGDVLIGVGGIIAAAPPFRIVGAGIAALGLALKSFAQGLRDDAARGGTSGGENTSDGRVLVPAGEIGWFKACMECRVLPGSRPRPVGGPRPRPGWRGGGGFDFGGSTGCGVTSPCGLGPELVFLLPWLLRRRQRRLEGSLKVPSGEVRENARRAAHAAAGACRMDDR